MSVSESIMSRSQFEWRRYFRPYMLMMPSSSESLLKELRYLEPLFTFPKTVYSVRSSVLLPVLKYQDVVAELRSGPGPEPAESAMARVPKVFGMIGLIVASLAMAAPSGIRFM